MSARIIEIKAHRKGCGGTKPSQTYRAFEPAGGKKTIPPSRKREFSHIDLQAGLVRLNARRHSTLDRVSRTVCERGGPEAACAQGQPGQEK